MSSRLPELPLIAERDAAQREERIGLPVALIGLLVLTIVICSLFSYFQFLWSDEFGILSTDSVRGVLHLIHVQRTSPVCLDPMAYHLIAHASILLFGADAFAIRLPSLIGYLTMQVCLFLFVRRCVGPSAALLAVALSTFSGPMLYATQARPYGVLMGFSSLVAVAWQTAVRRSSHRAAPLLLLALSLIFALNSHYYAVLLLIPLYAAEAVRTLQARKLDLPVVLAILAGTSGLLLVLPFVHGASVYQQHYYMQSGFNIHFVSHSWLWLLIGDPGVSPNILTAVKAVIASALLTVFLINRKQLRFSQLPVTAPELTLLVLFAALPFFGLFLGAYVTHAVEVRFVMAAIFGLLALLAMALSELFRGPALQRSLIVAFSLVAIVFGWLRISAIHRKSAGEWAIMKLPSVTLAALAARPGMPVFIQNPDIFQMQKYYARDTSVRDRLALVYSFQQDMLHVHSDTMSHTAHNLGPMTDFDIQPYEVLHSQPGEHLFVVYHNAFDWPLQAFAEDHAQVQYLGPAYGGDLVSVRFR